MDKKRMAARGAVPVFAVSGILVATSNADAAEFGDIVFAQDECGDTTITGSFSSGFNGYNENLEGNGLAGGVEVAVGIETQTSRGGTESFRIPMNSIGRVTADEHVLVTVTDVETTPLGIPVSVATVAKDLACHTDGSGTTCT